LEWAVLSVFLAEDRSRWQSQLHHITLDIVSQHNSKALLVTAGTALTIA
jgi:hypothetical protein